ncbi:MAG: cation diffusion facilitator family transporter [Eubacteriales bacterium]|nr:cation diffusion facilitator family transporter [Eubacteriales bacterium]
MSQVSEKQREESFEKKSREKSRDVQIIRTSVIGILANVLLAGFKAVVGMMSGSIAIVMDAVNNISDAASSIITIVGTKLAGKAPDRQHPFGHGRAEYLSAMIISVLVLYAGITAFVESVKKIIHPETPEYTAVTLIIVAVAVAVKILLGRYVKSVGERVNSDSLVNSGEDATLDSVISASTLVAAGIYILFHISLEAWLGAVIAIIIIKSGVDMLRETLSRILGERADMEMIQGIKKTIASYPEVHGVYDLILHNYGPDAFQGSVHIEVQDTLTAVQLDKLIRSISEDVYRQHNIILTAVGVYSINTHDPKAVEARTRVQKIVLAHPNIIQMHGFYLDEEEKTIRFDMVVSFDEKDRRSLYKEVCREVQEAYPNYTVNAALDLDFSVS